jgi:hypothetical protein
MRLSLYFFFMNIQSFFISINHKRKCTQAQTTYDHNTFRTFYITCTCWAVEQQRVLISASFLFFCFWTIFAGYLKNCSSGYKTIFNLTLYIFTHQGIYGHIFYRKFASLLGKICVHLQTENTKTTETMNASKTYRSTCKHTIFSACMS